MKYHGQNGQNWVGKRCSWARQQRQDACWNLQVVVACLCCSDFYQHVTWSESQINTICTDNIDISTCKMTAKNLWQWYLITRYWISQPIIHPFLSKMYHIKGKKQSLPIHILACFVLFYFLCYNYTYHNVSHIATIFWVTVSYPIQPPLSPITPTSHLVVFHTPPTPFWCVPRDAQLD